MVDFVDRLIRWLKPPNSYNYIFGFTPTIDIESQNL